MLILDLNYTNKLIRYSRQTILPEIGQKGQEKLSNSRLAIIGCGGLGSIVAPYLAGAGVHHLILVDGDKPEVSNLHRQVFFASDEKSTKAKALANHIKKSNPNVLIDIYEEMLDKSNISKILQHVDLVIECTDDILCKYLVNDYCHLEGLALVYAAIFKYEGYVSLFTNEEASNVHLRDIFPEPDYQVPNCSEVGVFNTIAGLIGILQANEALKFLLDIGNPLKGKLLTYNVLKNEQYIMKLQKSWYGNIKEVFKNEEYNSIVCKTNLLEIGYQTFQKNIEDYRVISVLEKDEHKDLVRVTEHKPLSSIDFDVLVIDQRPTIFYCMSGKRSLFVATEMKRKNPTKEIYSLKGGLSQILA